MLEEGIMIVIMLSSVILLFIYSAVAVSGRISREEEWQDLQKHIYK